MISEVILLQALIGGLGGLLGSLLHLLSQHKMRRKLYTNPLSLRADIGNILGWTISAMGTGFVLGMNNPLWGFLIGLFTGLLGVEFYKKIIMYFNPKEQLMYILERNKGAKSLEALKKMISSFDFIENVNIVEKLGEIDIKIEPASLYNSSLHLPLLSELINGIKPLGVAMNIIEPSPLQIKLSGFLHLDKGIDFNKVEPLVRKYIEDHINSLGLGNSFKLSILQAEISRGAIPGALDLYGVTTTPQINQRGSIEVPDNMLPKAGKIELKTGA